MVEFAVEFARRERVLLWVLGLATLASTVAQIWCQESNLVMAFGDAKSRMLLARQVTDSVNPGLAQLGAIWPVLPQLTALPFVWVNGLFYSGLAGALPQSISYVGTCGLLFLLEREVTRRTAPGVVAVFVYSVPNMLFLQAVPMSESMFNLGFVGAVYFFYRWIRAQERWILLVATEPFIVIASQTRYEGWVLFILFSCILLGLWRSRLLYSAEARAKATVFVFWPGLTTLLWLSYNWVYYHNPLYFLVSDYSASSIVKEAVAHAPKAYSSQGDLLKSLLVYTRTVADIAGVPILLFSLVGLTMFVVSARGWSEKAAMLVLLFPFPFFVYSLWAGGSVEIWHPYYTGGANWGTRYGVLMLPPVAIFSGYVFVNIRGALENGIRAAFAVSLAFTWAGGVLSAGEARQNRDNPQAVAQLAAGRWLRTAYDGGEVLLQRFQNETTIIESRVPLSRVVSEAAPRDLYQENLRYPVPQVRWVLTKRDAVTNNYDGVGTSVLKNPDFDRTFQPVYDDGQTQIWRRVTSLAGQ